MANSRDNIKNAVATLLTNNVPALKEVLDHEEPMIRQLPAARLISAASTQRREQGDRFMGWGLKIRVYVELRDAKTAEEQLDQLVHDIIKVFWDNRDLSGSCLFWDELRTEEPLQIDTQQKAMLAADIYFQAVKEE